MVVCEDSNLPTKQMQKIGDVLILTGSRAPATLNQTGPIEMDEPREKYPDDNQSTGVVGFFLLV